LIGEFEVNEDGETALITFVLSSRDRDRDIDRDIDRGIDIDR
jgi:hypothetical protein